MESEKEENEGRIYEVGYHLVSTVSAESLPEEAGKIKEKIIESGAVVISEEEPKLLSLAYPIYKEKDGKYKEFQSAYFGWIKFEADSENAAKLKEQLDANELVLRFLIIRTVRENTMSRKSPVTLRRSQGDEKKEGEVIDEVELDKTIDKLVIE